MKILFITEYINAPGQGAFMVANAHYNSFCEIFGKDNVDVVSIKTSNFNNNNNYINLSGYNKRIDRLKNLLDGFPPFMRKTI